MPKLELRGNSQAKFTCSRTVAAEWLSAAAAASQAGQAGWLAALDYEEVAIKVSGRTEESLKRCSCRVVAVVVVANELKSAAAAAVQSCRIVFLLVLLCLSHQCVCLCHSVCCSRRWLSLVVA